MKFTIPTPPQQEHVGLHDELRGGIQAGGEVGEAAKTLAPLRRPHFIKEGRIALPPLSVFADHAVAA